MASQSGLAGPAAVSFTDPPEVAAPVARYSHLATISAGHDLLVIAGQVGNERDGHVVESIEAQYEQALRNVVEILRSAGSDAAHLVKLNYYLVKPLDRELGAAIRKRVLGDVAPPTTFAYVVGLAKPDFLVEIDGLALRPAASKPAH